MSKTHTPTPTSRTAKSKPTATAKPLPAVITRNITHRFFLTSNSKKRPMLFDAGTNSCVHLSSVALEHRQLAELVTKALSEL
jgi:hypothetical protein